MRALVLLAREAEGRPMLGRDLAREAEVPPNYLSKILNTLKRVGILEASRGTHGGYRLLKTPEQIRLIDVVEVFDSPMAKPTCVLGGGRECDDVAPCSAHAQWRDVRRVYVEFLESTTLGSIADTHSFKTSGENQNSREPHKEESPTTIARK